MTKGFHGEMCVLTEKVGLGLIGLGYIGKVHLRHCLNLKSARLIAVSDISKRALDFAEKMGVRNTSTDYHTLLGNSEIDAVVITLPTHLHASCARSAAEAGKDVFVEKPLAREMKEGTELVSTARRNGVKLMVGYDMRFSPLFVNLRRKTRSGVLGEVQIAYATNIGAGPFFHRASLGIPKPVPTWWFRKDLAGGGALMDLGVHMINLLRWYFGEIVDIRSYLGYRYDLEVEDKATCITRFASGQIGIINVGWFSQESQKKIELLGTVRHAVACRTPENRILAAIKMIVGSSTQYESTYFRELQHFVSCIIHDSEPCTSGDDALRDLEIVSKAYKNKHLP